MDNSECLAQCDDIKSAGVRRGSPIPTDSVECQVAMGFICLKTQSMGGILCSSCWNWTAFP